MLRYPSIISPSSLNMKTTRFALALLALATCPAFAEYPEVLYDGGPYNQFVAYDENTPVNFTIAADSTKIVGKDENTNVTITGIAKDDAFIEQSGASEVVFVRGNFTNTGTIEAMQIGISTRRSYGYNPETVISGTTNFVNKGTIKTIPDNAGYGVLSIEAGATFINEGRVTAYTYVMGGSTLIAEEGSVFNYRVDVGNSVNTGTLQVNGAITMNGELWGTSGDIIIMEGGSIDMKGNDVTLTGVNLVYMVEGNVSELTPINTSDLFINADIDDSTSITVKGTDGSSYTTTMGQLVVPEPTTATLSLLALCGLAMRRRRAAH